MISITRDWKLKRKECNQVSYNVVSQAWVENIYVRLEEF